MREPGQVRAHRDSAARPRSTRPGPCARRRGSVAGRRVRGDARSRRPWCGSRAPGSLRGNVAARSGGRGSLRGNVRAQPRRGPARRAPGRCAGAYGRTVPGRRRRVRVPAGAGIDPLDVGRRTRTIPPALRRALQARDRGCRFPGCTHRPGRYRGNVCAALGRGGHGSGHGGGRVAAVPAPALATGWGRDAGGDRAGIARRPAAFREPTITGAGRAVLDTGILLAALITSG